MLKKQGLIVVMLLILISQSWLMGTTVARPLPQEESTIDSGQEELTDLRKALATSKKSQPITTLAPFFTKGRSLSVSYVWKKSKTETIYLCAMQKLAYSLPVVIRKVGNQWFSQTINMSGNGWRYAAVSDDQKELLAILEFEIESPGAYLDIISSIDSGATWQATGVLNKVNFQATFTSFSLTKEGQGRLTIDLDEGSEEAHSGLYHYDTLDGGASWSLPIFEHNYQGEERTPSTLPLVENNFYQPLPSVSQEIHKFSDFDKVAKQ